MRGRPSRRHRQLNDLREALKSGLPPRMQLTMNALGCIELGQVSGPEIPVITLAPSFAGSWVIDTIRVSLAAGHGTESSAGAEPRSAETESVGAAAVSRGTTRAIAPPVVSQRIPPLAALRLDLKIASALYYARCLPLSAERNDLAYRSNGLHALVIVHYPSGDDSYERIDEDAQIIARQLRTLGTVTALTLLPEEAADQLLTHKLAALVERRFQAAKPMLEAPAEQAQELFALFGKSDVVMVGGSSLYADAIVARAPVFAWRTPQPGTGPIAEAWRGFLSHRDNGRLARAQRRCLDELLQQLELEGSCRNERQALHLMITELVAALARSEERQSTGRTGPLQDGTQPSWIFSPTPSSHRPPLPARLKSYADRAKSLARKFNESPRRFARDSSRIWARPFKPWL